MQLSHIQLSREKGKVQFQSQLTPLDFPLGIMGDVSFLPSVSFPMSLLGRTSLPPVLKAVLDDSPATSFGA